MTETPEKLAVNRMNQIDVRISQLIKRVEANADLGTYVGRTVQNTVPSIIEMISEIVKHIGDDELTETITAKLAVLRFEQERFQDSD